MSRLVLAAVGVLGFSCATTQLALLREFLGAFSGNEIVLGLALGAWLLLMGMGAMMGRSAGALRDPLLWLAALEAMVALLPIAQVFLLRSLRNVLFVRGAEIGPAQTLFAVFLLLLPYCVCGGYALTLASAVLVSIKGQPGMGQVYSADAFGSIAGGFLFSLVLVQLMDHIAALTVPAAVCLLTAAALFFAARRPAAGYLAISGSVAIVAVVLVLDLDSLSTRLEYQGRNIVARAVSPYGGLLVVESAGQFDFLQNNVPIASSSDPRHAEETAHYGLAQRPNARRVLLVGGCISGAPAEILKHKSVETLDCLELDPEVPRLGARFMPGCFADQRIHVHSTDPRLFVRSMGSTDETRGGGTGVEGRAPYDVVLLDVPAPATLQLNRLFTTEFFQEVRRALAGDGVLAFSLGEYENYVSPELARLLGCANATLKSQFQNVKLLPGGRVFFLASNGPLYDDIASRLEAGGIKTTLMKRHYLETQLSADREADLARAVAGASGRNDDSDPSLYYYHLRHWLSQFDTRLGLVCGVLLALVFVYACFQRPAALALFTSGYAGASLQMVLLLSFQVLCGSVYYQVGIITSLFMVGLALGSWLASRPSSASAQPQPIAALVEAIPSLAALPSYPADGKSRGPAFFRGVLSKSDRHLLLSLSLLVALYAVLLPLLLRCLGGAAAAPLAGAKAVIGLLAVLLAAFLGMQFPIANRSFLGSAGAAASRSYAADFLGAFAGAMVTCTLIIPLIGVAGACYVAGGLNVLAAANLGFRARFT